MFMGYLLTRMIWYAKVGTTLFMLLNSELWAACFTQGSSNNRKFDHGKRTFKMLSVYRNRRFITGNVKLSIVVLLLFKK